MGCTGRYCENVNLVQMSVHVDASVVEWRDRKLNRFAGSELERKALFGPL